MIAGVNGGKHKIQYNNYKMSECVCMGKKVQQTLQNSFCFCFYRFRIIILTSFEKLFKFQFQLTHFVKFAANINDNINIK